MGLETAAIIASVAATAAGAGLAHGSARTQANISRAQGDFNAQQLRRKATEADAEGRRQAAERRIKMDHALSDQKAKAAVGGAGTEEGASYLDLRSDLTRRGEYLSDLEVTAGLQKRAESLDKANVTAWEGEAKGKAYEQQATGALVKGAFDTAAAGFKGAERMGLGRGTDSGAGSGSAWQVETRNTDGDLLLDGAYPDDMDGDYGFRRPTTGSGPRYYRPRRF